MLVEEFLFPAFVAQTTPLIGQAVYFESEEVGWMEAGYLLEMLCMLRCLLCRVLVAIEQEVADLVLVSVTVVFY